MGGGGGGGGDVEQLFRFHGPEFRVKEHWDFNLSVCILMTPTGLDTACLL